LLKYFRFKKKKEEEIKTNAKVEELSYDQACVGFQDAMHLTGLIILTIKREMDWDLGFAESQFIKRETSIRIKISIKQSNNTNNYTKQYQDFYIKNLI